MGECENIFKGKDTSKNIVIDFQLENEQLKEYLSEYLLSSLSNQIVETYSFLKDREEKQKKIDISFSTKKNKSKEQLLEYVSSIEDFRKKIEKKSSQSKEDKLIVNQCEVINEKNNIALLYDFLNKVSKIKSNIFNLSFEIRIVKSKKEDVLKICRISLSNEDKQILNIEFNFNDKSTSYDNISVTSDFVENIELIDTTTKEEFKQSIEYDSTIFSSITQNIDRWDRFPPFRYHFLHNSIFDFEDEIGSKSKQSIATQIVLQIINLSIVSVKNQFKRELVNHVSPLRATPKRYYFLDRANINTVLDTFDGNSLTEILKEDENVKNKVNKWLEKFGLKVDVATLQDVIHKLKIHQYSLDLDIIDVGFGISQILPVIVQGFLSFDNSLTMIEQPEIHLHPKMQADLADLFIDIVDGTPTKKSTFKKQTSNPKKYLLIETHSEYLLRRLGRRIAEGKILAKDVAVYFIEPPKDSDSNSSAEIKEKVVNETGFFEYPKDFMDSELEKDMFNFIGQQLNKK
ncbi:hypothetical protein FACS1894178_7240 [Bacteroidia bacterium]|nr:hypothetical protein FACS1894178_7240 [Bacteroidia bacterium]